MELKENKLYRRAEVEEAFGFSKSTLYKLMREECFPKPRKIGPRLVAWPGQDLISYVNNCEVSQ